MNYEKGYYKLFNELTDMIEKLQQIQYEAEQLVVHNYEISECKKKDK